ncbi:MAG TPA: hypothetical protein VF658_08325 [Pyrinomonadaceae bacterium]
MNYLFRGQLCGYICDECPEPLANVKVRLYRIQQGRDVTSLAVANPKNTFAILSDDEVKAKESSLLAEADTDENGNFTFELSERQRYDGEAFEVDVYCGNVPRTQIPRDPPPPLQFSITVVQPMWHQSERGLVAVWDYCVPHRYWCGIKARRGLWTICGRVVDCERKAPIAGVKVRAFDVDWWQHDELGSAITDVTGRFRIDYMPINFKQTPFSPWGINVEWFGGPDVYFRVENPFTGAPLLEEPRWRGETPGRANRGSCFCVELCIDPDKVPDGEHQDTIPQFTNVGVYVVNPGDADFATNGFTPDGTTIVGGYAFTGTIPLRGLLPDGDSADALEYHFRVGEYNEDGTILGAVSDIEADKIAPTIIGKLQYYYWNGIGWSTAATDYYANNPGAGPVTIPQPAGPSLSVPRNVNVKPGGWIEVPRINELFLGGRGRFIGGSVNLINLNTTTLTNESFDLIAPPPVIDAGESIPAGKKSRKHRFRIFYEARKVSDGTGVSSNDREKIAISNTSYLQRRHTNWAGGDVSLPAVVSLNVDELVGEGCKEVDNEVHALFTVYHPFVGSGRIFIEGPGPASVPPQINLAFSADGEAVSPAGGAAFDITAKPPCAYIMWLKVDLLLTSGYGAAYGTFDDHIAFCKGMPMP